MAFWASRARQGGREVTSPLGPWTTMARPRVQLWDPHHGTDSGTLEHSQLMESHQADWGLEYRIARAWGNWVWAAVRQEGQGDTWVPPAASQSTETETEPSQRNTGTGQHTVPACGNSQGGRQEIVRYKMIYSEVDQTLEQVPREVMQSPSLEVQKAHLD